MSLMYTEDEQEFRLQLRDFLKQELEPLVLQIESEELSPIEFIRNLGANGYMGSLYPKELGGTGKGIVYDSIVSEEVAYISPVTDTCRSVTSIMSSAPIFRFGTPEQKEKYLKPLIAGQAVGAIAISEPTGGSDAAGMRTRAQREGDNYIIKGQKHWITNAGIADFITLFAITNPDVHPHQGMSAFIVETKMPGFRVVLNPEVMGLRGVPHSQIEFDDVVLPAGNRLGEENQGWHVLTDELGSERINIASRVLGAANRCYEEALRHSATREQFGRKIRSFEGVSFKIAEMKCDLDAARMLILRAARMYDQGLKVEKEAAIAKLFATERGFQIADKALQIHGAQGYCKVSPVEQFFRDIRAYRLGGGTDEIMKFLIQREEYREFGF
ncbi:MAG: acyl-CoA/acyl-ACP dehydrogenase [Desulfobacteraceae bacterium]|nr:acyl-CoA/acyl-ACP dehydrogenase [Desulfobacteraceae bacterium]